MKPFILHLQSVFEFEVRVMWCIDLVEWYYEDRVLDRRMQRTVHLHLSLLLPVFAFTRSKVLAKGLRLLVLLFREVTWRANRA